MFFYDKKHLTFNCWYNWRNSIYIPKPLFGSFLLDFLIKPLPIWCLAIYTYQKKNALLTVGLLFGSLGDIFLTNSEEVYFKLGLSSFLIQNTIAISIIHDTFILS